jgi:hypothetical protein
MGPTPFTLFQINFKLFQALKFKIEAFSSLKNSQALHEARIELYEQPSPLAQLQIPNGCHVIKFETNLNLKLPRILKGFKPLRKNLVNSLKFYPYLIFTKVNLVGHTCMLEIEVSIQVS